MINRTPLVVELFCGRFGWSKGFVANGYRSIGFDIAHEGYHGPVPEGCSLALQDVLTLHGSQFRDAACIVASPPCQEYSYMAMPFSRGKQKAKEYRDGTRNVADLTRLFDACFRIQREASEAAGRYIPMVVENVKGAQPWVGPAKAHFGSFYLWGDVESVGGRIVAGGLRFGQTLRPPSKEKKVPGFNFHEFAKTGKPGRSFQSAAVEGCKVPSESGRRTDVGNGARFTSRDCGLERGNKGFASRFEDTPMARHGSASPARKAASAMIAEISFVLSDWLARCFHPDTSATPQRTKYPVRASA